MGLWKWTVKKHLKPKNFNKLSDDILEKYAKVFDITKEELIDMNWNNGVVE